MRTLAVAAAVLLAACGGGDNMQPPKPCAMWPVVVGATNKWIDIDVYAYDTWLQASGAIPQGTYYSPADLAAAVKAGLDAAWDPHRVTIWKPWNDATANTLRVDVGGVQYTATLPVPLAVDDGAGHTNHAGLYRPNDELPAAVVAALQAVVANAWVVVRDPATGKLTIYGAAAWKPIAQASDAWLELGVVVANHGAAALSHVADAAVLVPAGWAVDVTETGHVRIRGGAEPTGLNALIWRHTWSTGGHAANSAAALLGFDPGADTPWPWVTNIGTTDTADVVEPTTDGFGGGGLTIHANRLAAPLQHPGGWYPGECVADDTGELEEHTRSQAVALAGPGKSLHFATRTVRDVRFAMLPAWKWRIADEGAGHLNEAFQRLLASGWARFRWFDDATNLASGTDYFFDLDTAKRLERSRLSPGAPLYGLALRMRKYV